MLNNNVCIETFQMNEGEKKERNRETWDGKLDFLFSALGYAGICVLLI